MAEKLFPPILDSKLPAFTGNSFIVTFTMNRSVGIHDIIGMQAVIKTATTGKIIGTVRSAGAPQSSAEYSAVYNVRYSGQEGKYIASFTCPESFNLKIGQYYKIQIAYIGKKDLEEVVGYYSSTGIIKKTAEPEISILGLEESLFSRYNYTGRYLQQDDPSEKVYSYCFDLYDLDNKLIDTSGDCLHNSATDQSSVESTDTWFASVELQTEVPYILKYTVTTTNGLQKTITSNITTTESVDIDLDIALTSKLNYEDGIIELYLEPKNNDETIVTGSFVLVRSSSLNNFSAWDEVYRFSYLNFKLYKNTPLLLWEDFSIHQGEEYIYALQAYNSHNLYSNRLKTSNDTILADFEHCYISDANRQLKIQFNPKISSFKNNVLETKIDTLGSQYPFIFKSGYVHYKEFPISGLLSLLSDNNGKFSPKYNQQINIDKRVRTPGFGETKKITTNLDSVNIYNERQYKTEVLEWLNNGEPKMFRSPTEGNFIVRIMNVSLTPNDTLGRMLHTLNCTAYEIADWNFTNLINYKLVNFPEGRSSTLRIGQVRPQEMIATNKFINNYPLFTLENDTTINFPPSYSVNITDATPGTKFQLKFLSGDVPVIEIGGTGSYYVQVAQLPSEIENNYFNGISLISGHWNNAKITFEYYDDTPADTFSQIIGLDLTEEIRRFVGPGYEINLVESARGGSNTNNILADIRREIGMFHFIRVEKRYIQEMWKTPDDKYARNSLFTDIIQDDEWNPVVIYHDNVTNKYYDGDISRELDGEPDFRFCLNNVETKYSDFGGRVMELNDTVAYGNTFGRIDSLRNIEKVEVLRAGNGILLDVAYRVRIKEYGVESSNNAVKIAKQGWKNARTNLFNLLSGKIPHKIPDTNNIKSYTAEVNSKYAAYIWELTDALKRQNQ